MPANWQFTNKPTAGGAGQNEEANMDIKNAGGPAFPCPENADEWGMTLRDYFAAKALDALILKDHKEHEHRGARGVPVLAKFAYEYADAMLTERAK
jgi:hypothetical protein